MIRGITLKPAALILIGVAALLTWAWWLRPALPADLWAGAQPTVPVTAEHAAADMETSLSERPALSAASTRQRQPAPLPNTQRTDVHGHTQAPDATASDNGASPAEDRLPADVTAEAYPLAWQRLKDLQAGDHITLPDPQGGSLTLTVTRVRDRDSHRSIQVHSQGLASTFTVSDTGFYGTLATTRGVYGLQNDGDSSLLIDQRQLEQRWNSHSQDYLRPPSDART